MLKWSFLCAIPEVSANVAEKRDMAENLKRFATLAIW